MTIMMGVLALVLLPAATAFYLPGVAPQQYENFESVAMKVNKLTSIKTQLPYEYYALPFCQPTAARCMELVDGHRWRGRDCAVVPAALRCADTPLFGIALQPCN